MVYEMLVGFAPFTGYDTRSLAQNLRKGDYAVPKAVALTVSCFDFIDKCLKSDPVKWIKHDLLLDHTFCSLKIAGQVINLQASCIGGTPFVNPKSVNQLNKTNSYTLNINESTLFNEEIAKQITRYYTQQDDAGLPSQKTPEELKWEMDEMKLKVTQYLP